jgi:hypothetical protein
LYRLRALLSHVALALAEAGLIALLVVGLIAGTAFAAKGGGHGSGHTTTGSGSINLVLMNGDLEAHFGAQVTFDISTTATDSPFVHLTCYQAGSLVLEGWQGFFPTALGDEWFYLGPTPAWQGGAADCAANLEKYGKRGSWSVLASANFHVYE